MPTLALRELAPMVVAMGGVTLILILSGLMQRNLDKKPISPHGPLSVDVSLFL